MRFIELPNLKQHLARQKHESRCREVERLVAEKSIAVAEACRLAGMSTWTYYRYKKARR